MTILTALIVLALLATIVALGWGVGSMVHGGDYDARHSTQFMVARIGFQGLAVLFLIIAFLIAL